VCCCCLGCSWRIVYILYRIYVQIRWQNFALQPFHGVLLQNSLQKSVKVVQNQGLSQTFFTGLDPVSGTFHRVVSRSFGAKSTLKPTETKITICTLNRQPLGNSVNSPSLWVKFADFSGEFPAKHYSHLTMYYRIFTVYISSGGPGSMLSLFIDTQL
jgi:hypothetical protein